MYATRPKGLLLDPTFRRGFACLAPLDLSFDAWLFHPQIRELTDLARAFPDTRIVLDHCGGPIGVGSYANRRQEIFPVWQAQLREIVQMPQCRGETRWPRDAATGLRFSRTSDTAIVGRRGGRLASLCRELHRGVRPRTLHVRKQLSARQGPMQLSGDLQRVQAHRRALQRDREDRAVSKDRDRFLPAWVALFST